MCVYYWMYIRLRRREMINLRILIGNLRLFVWQLKRRGNEGMVKLLPLTAASLILLLVAIQNWILLPSFWKLVLILLLDLLVWMCLSSVLCIWNCTVGLQCVLEGIGQTRENKMSFQATMATISFVLKEELESNQNRTLEPFYGKTHTEGNNACYTYYFKYLHMYSVIYVCI